MRVPSPPAPSLPLIVLLLAAATGAWFIGALRIATPKAVTASVPAAGAASSRQLQSVVAGIVSETTTVVSDEPDTPALTVDSAARLAGFTPRLLGARADRASLTVTGAHALDARVNEGQLRTLFTEAGLPWRTRGPTLDGAPPPIALATPRAVRAEYGNCPAPLAATLQNQIQGPPPPSTDNGNCVIVTEAPLGSATMPAALDSSAVMEIALELLGMSPRQARDFRGLFDWRAAITLAPPRFVRSYEIVNIGSVRGMLMVTGGRRGPTYELAWQDRGIVYTISGYGSSADAVPLARSVQ